MIRFLLRVMLSVVIISFSAALNKSHAGEPIVNKQISDINHIPFISQNTFFGERYYLPDNGELYNPSDVLYLNNTNINGARKSPFRAALYSLILPGAGEYYAGNFSTGRYLLGSEITLWMTILGFYSYGSWLRNDARSFAEVHAGVNWSGKDNQFFVDIGNFMTRQEYNDKKMRDRDISLLYTDAAYDWHWESVEKRREYRDMRVKSDQMFNAIKFAGAAVIANHIVSAIIAGNSAVNHNESLGGITVKTGWSFGIVPLNNGFVAGIQHNF